MDIAKRSADIIVAAIGLVLLSPLLAAIAVVVRLTTPGPVIFRQVRVGRYGRPFHIHKFRTMYADSSGVNISASGDARVTPVGAWLRRTKLDELPQLADVLRGEMSIVGPRPEVPAYVALWPEAIRDEVVSIRPGITDPGSVMFRDEADLLAKADDPEQHYIGVIIPAKLAAYVEYCRTRSLRGDVRIILDTVRRLVRG